MQFGGAADDFTADQRDIGLQHRVNLVPALGGFAHDGEAGVFIGLDQLQRVEDKSELHKRPYSAGAVRSSSREAASMARRAMTP